MQINVASLEFVAGEQGTQQAKLTRIFSAQDDAG